MTLALVRTRAVPVAADYRILVAALIAAQATTPTARLCAGATAVAPGALGHGFGAVRDLLSRRDAGAQQGDQALYRPVSGFLEAGPVEPTPMMTMAAERALGAATRG